MSERLLASRPFKFFDRCTDFYQEIANIKQAVAEGRLAAYVAPGETDSLVTPSDFAKRISARLVKILLQQERDFQREGSPAEKHIHRITLYVMAILADEIFILELDWMARDAWLDVMLEQRLFNTNQAGSRFFSLARQLIKKPGHSVLDMDLAAVFLMALELGFKGCYRGPEGRATLRKIRAHLYRVAQQVDPQGLPSRLHTHEQQAPAFPQAYQYLLRNGKDERLAPSSPWRALSVYALAGYLVISMMAWLVLMHPFDKYLAASVRFY